jgi:hypothetical protein
MAASLPVLILKTCRFFPEETTIPNIAAHFPQLDLAAWDTI